MRHLSIRQKSSSAASVDWDSTQKSGTKPCVTSKETKPPPSLGRGSPPGPCSKPCSAPADPQGASASRDRLKEAAGCKCSVTPCQTCRKPNGPVAEEGEPPKANGPVDCNSASEPHHRLKPAGTTDPDPAPAPAGLGNHIGVETVKREPESSMEVCTQKSCPSAPTIWTPTGQQNHCSSPGDATSQDDKSSHLITSSAPSAGPPKGIQDPTKRETSSSTPGTDVCMCLPACLPE